VIRTESPRGPLPPSLYFHQQPMRDAHSLSPHMTTTKTNWIFSPTAAGKPKPQRTMSQKMLVPILHRRFPGPRMKNPLAGLGRKQPNQFARVERIPLPIQIHCCVRYTPGFEPEYLHMRVLKPHSTNQQLHGETRWESNRLENSGHVSEAEPSYDIPFPEYTCKLPLIPCKDFTPRSRNSYFSFRLGHERGGGIKSTGILNTSSPNFLCFCRRE